MESKAGKTSSDDSEAPSSDINLGRKPVSIPPFSSPNPNKRQHPPSTPSTPDDPKPTPHEESSPDSIPRKVTLESYATVHCFDTPIKGRFHRQLRAEAKAEELDYDRYLDPTESIITSRGQTGGLSSPREIFIHYNKRQYLNDILIKEEEERLQDATARTLIECVMAELGYRPVYGGHKAAATMASGMSTGNDVHLTQLRR